jgi:hypothetical protein
MTYKLAQLWAPIVAAASLLAGTASAGCATCSNCPASSCCTARKTPYLDGRVQFGYFATNWQRWNGEPATTVIRSEIIAT